MSSPQRPDLHGRGFSAEEYLKRINSEDRVGIVISGHLYIEAALIQLIERALPYPGDFGEETWRRLSFPSKLELGVALDVMDPRETPAYLKVNQLRNRIAHRLGETITVGDVEDLLDTMDASQRQNVGPHPVAASLQPALVVLFTLIQVRLEGLGQTAPSKRRDRYGEMLQVATKEPIGEVTHYFARLGVAAAALTGGLAVGDRIRVKGHTTDLTQTVESLEIEHQKVGRAVPGAHVAFRVSAKVRAGDKVFRITAG